MCPENALIIRATQLEMKLVRHAAELPGTNTLDCHRLAEQGQKPRTLTPRSAELTEVGAREAHMRVPEQLRRRGKLPCPRGSRVLEDEWHQSKEASPGQATAKIETLVATQDLALITRPKPWEAGEVSRIPECGRPPGMIAGLAEALTRESSEHKGDLVGLYPPDDEVLEATLAQVVRNAEPHVDGEDVVPKLPNAA